jgi:acetate kinase
VGENGAMLRELACSGLEWAGIALDAAANEAAVRGRAGEVQAPHSRVKASRA